MIERRLVSLSKRIVKAQDNAPAVFAYHDSNEMIYFRR